MTILPGWWRVHFLAAEMGLSLIITICFAIWVECFGGALPLEQTLAGNRNAVYGTLASIFGSLLGFVITAVSIVLGYSASDRLQIVRESKHYPILWKTFIAAIRCLGLATLVAMLGLPLDRDASGRRWILNLCVFASLLAIARLARCVWILENVVRLVTFHPKKD